MLSSFLIQMNIINCRKFIMIVKSVGSIIILLKSDLL